MPTWACFLVCVPTVGVTIFSLFQVDLTTLVYYAMCQANFLALYALRRVLSGRVRVWRPAKMVGGQRPATTR